MSHEKLGSEPIITEDNVKPQQLAEELARQSDLRLDKYSGCWNRKYSSHNSFNFECSDLATSPTSTDKSLSLEVEDAPHFRWASLRLLAPQNGSERLGSGGTKSRLRSSSMPWATFWQATRGKAQGRIR